MSPVATATTTEIIAGFWWRFLGFIVDSIILGLVIVIPVRAMNLSFYSESAAQVVAAFVYFGLFVRYRTWTPGMRLFRMRVLSSDGSRVTPSQALTRSGVYCVLLLIASLYQLHTYSHPTTAETRALTREFGIYLVFALPHYVDLLWAGFGPLHQTLHDKSAATIVVRRRSL
jgi:uncharacterized RDD family membrane protein YckC